MKEKRLFEHAVIIAPRAYHEVMLAYRKEYPYADFKLMTLEEVESLFHYQYDDRAILELLKRGYGFNRSLDMLDAMKAMKLDGIYHDQKLVFLMPLLREFVSSNLLYSTAFPEKTFQGRQIVVIGYASGKRIANALQELPNISLSWDKSFDEIDESKKKVMSFPDVHAELHYVFNQIAHDIDNGIDPETIYICGADSDMRFEMEQLMLRYGFSIDLQSDRTLLELPLSRYFLAELDSDNAIEGGESVDSALLLTRKKFPDDPNLDAFSVAILTYKEAASSLGKEERISLFEDLLMRLNAKKPKCHGAVKILHGCFIPPNSRVYLLNFRQKKAPHIYMDNDYLSDEAKKEIGLPTSMLLNEEERLSWQKMLFSSSIAEITFSARKMDQSYYLSSFAKELDMEVVENPSLPYEYSERFAKLMVSDMEDQRKKYHRNPPLLPFLKHALDLPSFYRSYNNMFGPAVPSKRSRVYSFSSIDDFYHCPFSYFAGRVLKLEDEDDVWNLRIGNLVHDVFFHLDDPSFSFSCQWEASLAEQIKNDGPFSPKESILLEGIKKRIELCLDFVKKHESVMHVPHVFREKELRTDFDNGVSIYGKIDKAIVTEDRYITLIDYKTGKTEFNPSHLSYGLSMQLPIYALLASNSPEFSEKEILGVFIQHVLYDKYVYELKEEEKSPWDTYFRLSGVYLADVDALESIDPTYMDSQFIAGLKLTKEGAFSKKNASAISLETLQNYIDTAEEKIFEADEAIQKGYFPILPIEGNKAPLPCSYCPYADVCFVRGYQRRFMRSEPKEGEESEGK